jgi:hypothetical protein
VAVDAPDLTGRQRDRVEPERRDAQLAPQLLEAVALGDAELREGDAVVYGRDPTR